MGTEFPKLRYPIRRKWARDSPPRWYTSDEDLLWGLLSILIVLFLLGLVLGVWTSVYDNRERLSTEHKQLRRYGYYLIQERR